MKIRLYPPGRQIRYPHFFGDDFILLNRFWDINKIQFNSVAYDVPVLGFFEYGKVENEAINNNWEYLASLKIDMVGFTSDTTYIFEFKHVSKPEGLGQLLTYKHLCEKHHIFEKPYKLYFVSYDIRPILKEMFSMYSIDFIEIPYVDYSTLF
jgi:hypothetical protein